MTRCVFSSLIAVILLLSCSCANQRAQAKLNTSVSRLQQYADSFKGMNKDEVRSRMVGAKITEKEWESGKFGGKELVATFPMYQIRFLFLDDEIITTSIQVLSK